MSTIPQVILVLGLTSWIGICRLVRGQLLALREKEYIGKIKPLVPNSR